MRYQCGSALQRNRRQSLVMPTRHANAPKPKKALRSAAPSLVPFKAEQQNGSDVDIDDDDDTESDDGPEPEDVRRSPSYSSPCDRLHLTATAALVAAPRSHGRS